MGAALTQSLLLPAASLQQQALQEELSVMRERMEQERLQNELDMLRLKAHHQVSLSLSLFLCLSLSCLSPPCPPCARCTTALSERMLRHGVRPAQCALE